MKMVPITMTERASLNRKTGPRVIDMNGNTKIKRIIFVISGIILITGIVMIMWLRGVFLPRWVTWKTVTSKYADKAELVLKHKTFSLKTPDGSIVWKSEAGWLVSDFIVGDIDHDDEDEIILLVWRRGSFGKFKPIWVEKDEKTWSQHIFIYDYLDNRDDRMKPVWMSSKMGIEASDIKLDEKEALHIITPEGKDTVWYWQSWGLTLIEG